MAREAGWKDLRAYDSAMQHDFFMGNTDSLRAFEALVRADERDDILRMSGNQWFKSQTRYDEAIRARDNT
jgi:hypothetical protein